MDIANLAMQVAVVIGLNEAITENDKRFGRISKTDTLFMVYNKLKEVKI